MKEIKGDCVSVILPCYNVEKFLEESLDSILNQSYGNLRIVCVDDGSTDETFEVLKRYELSDHRVVAFSNGSNKGLIYTLNRLVDLCETDLIVRMDPDDVSEADRIERLIRKQVETDADVVSSAYCFIDVSGKVTSRPWFRLPTRDAALKYVSLFNSPLAHATVLYKRKFVKKYGYSREWIAAEDYDLWIRALADDQEVVFANIDDFLYRYRIYDASESNVRRSTQQSNHIKIAARARRIFTPGVINPASVIFSRLTQQEMATLNRRACFREAVLDVYSCIQEYCKRYQPSFLDRVEIWKYSSRYVVYLVYKYLTLGSRGGGWHAFLADVARFVIFNSKFPLLLVSNLYLARNPISLWFGR